MQWNESTQERFNALRVKKFEVGLNDEEAAELAIFQAAVEDETAGYLSPLITSLEEENGVMMRKLDATREENVVLLRLIEQQKQLVADALLSNEPNEQPTPTFGSAKGLVKIENNFDDPIEGF